MLKITTIILCLLLSVTANAGTIDVPIYGQQPIPSDNDQALKSSKVNEKSVSKTKSAKQLKKETKSVKSLPPPSEITLNFARAINNNNFELAELYLKQGADINCRNCDEAGSPPIVSSFRPFDNPVQTIDWLLTHGADVNLTNNNGENILFYAIGQPKTVAYLLDHGASPNVKNKSGNTPILKLTENVPNDIRFDTYMVGEENAQRTEKVWFSQYENLVAKGADVNAINKNGDNQLTLVAARGQCNVGVVKTLIKDGVKTDRKNNLGLSAYAIALKVATNTNRKYCNEIVEVLSGKDSASTAIIKTTNSNQAASTNKNSNSEWLGSMKSHYPKYVSWDFSLSKASNGDVKFSNSNGLQGSGHFNQSDNKLTGTLVAVSTKDSSGRYTLGASEVNYDLSGTIENGMIKGSFKSIIDEGYFVLCDSDAQKNPALNCKEAFSTTNPLSVLLNGLKTISGQ